MHCLSAISISLFLYLSLSPSRIIPYELTMTPCHILSILIRFRCFSHTCIVSQGVWWHLPRLRTYPHPPFSKKSPVLASMASVISVIHAEPVTRLSRPSRQPRTIAAITPTSQSHCSHLDLSKGLLPSGERKPERQKD